MRVGLTCGSHAGNSDCHTNPTIGTDYLSTDGVPTACGAHTGNLDRSLLLKYFFQVVLQKTI